MSSCSSKNQITDRQRHRRDVLMARLWPRVAARLPLEEPRPPRLFHVLQPPHHQHQGVQALGLAQELVVSAGLDGLTGMTAQNWKRYAVNHLRNSVKRSISSAKMMMPLPLKPEASLVNARRWCYLPAWPVLPSRELSTSQLRSQLPPSGSGVRKPLVNVSVAARWSFVPQGKPNRYGPR